jgi:hypothetical protein
MDQINASKASLLPANRTNYLQSLHTWYSLAQVLTLNRKFKLLPHLYRGLLIYRKLILKQLVDVQIIYIRTYQCSPHVISTRDLFLWICKSYGTSVLRVLLQCTKNSKPKNNTNIYSDRCALNILKPTRFWFTLRKQKRAQCFFLFTSKFELYYNLFISW